MTNIVQVVDELDGQLFSPTAGKAGFVQTYNQGPTLGTINAPGGTLAVVCGPWSMIGVRITGAFSGVLNFQQSPDGTNYISKNLNPAGQGSAQAPINNASAPGVWKGPAGGMASFQVVAASGFTGVATVEILQTSGNAEVGVPALEYVMGQQTDTLPLTPTQAASVIGKLTYIANALSSLVNLSTNALGFGASATAQRTTTASDDLLLAAVTSATPVQIADGYSSTKINSANTPVNAKTTAAVFQGVVLDPTIIGNAVGSADVLKVYDGLLGTGTLIWQYSQGALAAGTGHPPGALLTTTALSYVLSGTGSLGQYVGLSK